ncbi:hypothetical protein B7463_g1159, partial [Scytalidium lignicola]
MISTDYDATFFDHLPDIPQSYHRLIFRNGPQHISKAIHPLFIRYGVTDIFGVRLLHRHYLLSSNERIVQRGDVAAPWPLDRIQFAKTKGHVIPSSWLFRNGNAYPYEFSFVAKSENHDPATLLQLNDYENFFSDFCKLLQKYQLCDVLGLCLLDRPRRPREGSTLEINLDADRISINLPSSDIGHGLEDLTSVIENEGSDIPAAWCFYDIFPEERDAGDYQAPTSEEAFRGIICRHVCTSVHHFDPKGKNTMISHTEAIWS